ncbi:MAG: divalent-cation tolerance protein CutA [Nitrospira sp.]|nr:divalent-cation tolerance protein CutA [Nitrospira sp.]ULA68209.1 MAG: Divalent-cation tolerance protein CutA [Nitrospira sp.]
MNAQDSEVVVLVTTASYEEAEKIGRIIVESRLAACANVLNGMHSIFRWDNKINVENECLMIIKTTLQRYSELEAVIRQHHSYSVPEIIALPVVAGSVPYLNWIRSETSK